MSVPMCDGCPMDFPECCMAVEFKPCAIYYPEGNYTEIVLEDVPTVWVDDACGFDMDTGKLVAMRVPGDKTNRLTN